MSDLSPLAIGAAVIAAGSLLWWFVELEHRDQRETIFGVIFAVFLIELLLYQSEANVPDGLARIPFRGGGLRPVEILLPLAVGARWVTSDAPTRVSATALAWLAFLGWYATAGVMGLLAGNPTNEVLAQAKAIITIGGGIVLVSGLRPERLVRPRAMGRWAAVLAVVSIVWFAVTLGGASVAVNLPMLPVPRLGSLSVDAQLVLPVVGLIVLLVEACRRERRAWVAGAGLAMLPAPIVGTQRAAYIGVGALLVAVLLAALGRTWSRRLAVTPTEVVLLLLFLGGSLVATTLVRDDPPIDVSAQFEDSFNTASDERTTRARLRLWADAVDMIAEHPVMGSGLGTRQPLRHEWDPTQVVETTPHNIALDVAVRSGLAGLVLMIVAFGLTFTEGIRTWRTHDDQLVAALALAAVVGISAFLANAAVQTAMDQFRNTTLLGLLVGLVTCCARSAREAEALPPAVRAPASELVDQLDRRRG